MVANASKAIKNDHIRKMQTAADFNAREEEKAKQKKAEEEAAGVKKTPVMTKDGKLYICANKGCRDKNKFDLEKNGPEACHYHKGEPVFHDLKKYWSCCPDKTTWDWDDFMKIPTCSVGEHKMKYK